jgi:reprolysin-like metallo-peptidase family M12B
MASLRQIAQCIGITGNFSILRDFFGYVSIPKPLSTRTQILRLKQKHVHMNLIRVGIESFSANDEREIDAAVQFTRDTYATVNLGIGRVQRFFITTDEANGRDNIGCDGEAEELTNEWTVDNNALDVFFVLTYAGSTIGLSAVDGSCDKDAKGMDGSVVAIDGEEFKTTGFVLAHEVGHYLGLEHVGDSSNLMFPSVENSGNLSSGQGSTMRDHCFVRSAC